MKRTITFALLGKLVHEKLFGSPPVVTEETDDHPIEHVLHLKWETCSTCDGKGTHVNPSIDAHGISSEEFDEDPSFHEEYRRGSFDVQCYECDGRTTSLQIDRKRSSEEAIKAAEDIIADENDYRQTCESERRMGA